MSLTDRKWLHRMFLSGVYMLGILGIVASGGGGGGGGGGSVSFPTPTLPANAVVITGVNATDVATSAIIFSRIVSGAGGKSEAPPSYWEIIKQATDPIIKRNRDSVSVATGVIEDLSFLCINAPAGTAIADYNESGNSIAGVITYTNCELFFGVFVSGNTSVSASFNFNTGDYSQQLGGTLTISLAPDTVTIVFNAGESGNDFSGAFSATVSFSLAGIADETYLVTTAQTLIGNYFNPPFPQLTDGELIVTGGVDLGPDNTRLSLRVAPGDMVDVFLDDGQGGGFVYHSSVDLTTI